MCLKGRNIAVVLQCSPLKSNRGRSIFCNLTAPIISRGGLLLIIPLCITNFLKPFVSRPTSAPDGNTACGLLWASHFVILKFNLPFALIKSVTEDLLRAYSTCRFMQFLSFYSPASCLSQLVFLSTCQMIPDFITKDGFSLERPCLPVAYLGNMYLKTSSRMTPLEGVAFTS